MKGVGRRNGERSWNRQGQQKKRKGKSKGGDSEGKRRERKINEVELRGGSQKKGTVREYDAG